MDNRTARRATIILGVIMVIAIGSSAILPLFTRQANQALTPQPTTAPSPTFPPPVTDFSTIQFNQDVLHISGLFSLAQPTGWVAGQQTSNPTGAELTMNNADLLSVIQASVQVAAVPLANLDALDAIYTKQALDASWSNYRNPRETARTRENDRIIIDFELKNARQQTFLARQVSWYDTDWIYSVRVVTPENQINLLKYVIDNLIPTFKPNRIFAGTPADWRAYFDPTASFVIRYPSAWTLTDSAPGRPASIDGSNVALRLQGQSVSAPLDETAARAWVTSAVSGAAITSVQPVTRGGQNGFSVAYTYTDSDGNPNSGLALLINSADNVVYSANLRLFEPNVDLNTDTAIAAHPDLAQVLGTFQLLSGLNVPLPTATPTLTLPPPSPTLEATPTFTATATFTATLTFTPEPPTATFTSTPVPPTATATNTPVPPTNTFTAVPPTATATNTRVPPTSTPRPSSTPTLEVTPEVTPG